MSMKLAEAQGLITFTSEPKIEDWSLPNVTASTNVPWGTTNSTRIMIEAALASGPPPPSFSPCVAQMIPGRHGATGPQIGPQTVVLAATNVANRDVVYRDAVDLIEIAARAGQEIRVSTLPTGVRVVGIGMRPEVPKKIPSVSFDPHDELSYLTHEVSVRKILRDRADPLEVFAYLPVGFIRDMERVLSDEANYRTSTRDTQQHGVVIHTHRQGDIPIPTCPMGIPVVLATHRTNGFPSAATVLQFLRTRYPDHMHTVPMDQLYARIVYFMSCWDSGRINRTALAAHLGTRLALEDAHA